MDGCFCMQLIDRKFLIDQLDSQLSSCYEGFATHQIDIFERSANEELCYLGFRVIQDEQIFEIFLPYLKYGTAQLIPLTPIWTVMEVYPWRNYRRGFERLEDAFHVLKTHQSHVS